MRHLARPFPHAGSPGSARTITPAPLLRAEGAVAAQSRHRPLRRRTSRFLAATLFMTDCAERPTLAMAGGAQERWS
jgi:hypothetical protein